MLVVSSVVDSPKKGLACILFLPQLIPPKRGLTRASGFKPHWRPQPAKLPSFGGCSLETLPYLTFDPRIVSISVLMQLNQPSKQLQLKQPKGVWPAHFQPTIRQQKDYQNNCTLMAQTFPMQVSSLQFPSCIFLKVRSQGVASLKSPIPV